MIEKKEKIIKDESFFVSVTSDSLNVRSTPKNDDDSNIVYQITDHSTHKINGTSNGFGRIEDGNWIMLEYTKRIEVNG